MDIAIDAPPEKPPVDRADLEERLRFETPVGEEIVLGRRRERGVDRVAGDEKEDEQICINLEPSRTECCGGHDEDRSHHDRSLPRQDRERCGADRDSEQQPFPHPGGRFTRRRGDAESERETDYECEREEGQLRNHRVLRSTTPSRPRQTIANPGTRGSQRYAAITFARARLSGRGRSCSSSSGTTSRPVSGYSARV